MMNHSHNLQQIIEVAGKPDHCINYHRKGKNIKEMPQ